MQGWQWERCGPFPQDAYSLEEADPINETEMERSGKWLAGLPVQMDRCRIVQRCRNWEESKFLDKDGQIQREISRNWLWVWSDLVWGCVLFTCWARSQTPQTCMNEWWEYESTEHWILFFLRFYLFIFREEERKGEREGVKQQYERETATGCLLHAIPHPPHPPCPNRDLACSPGMCPDQELNWWPLGL